MIAAIYRSCFQRNYSIAQHACIAKACGLGMKRPSSSRSIDLSEPHLWYIDARKIRRRIICHIGPTNSGAVF